MNSQNSPFVSVIIPVFNDAKRLKICLEALQNQTYSRGSYEVIVVDNRSTEDIKSVVEQYSQAVYAYEEHQTSYAARNRGIAVAKGEVLAFTDADCVPAPDWIEQGVACLVRHPHCGLVAGRVEVFAQDPARPTAVEMHQLAMAFRQSKYLDKAKGCVTANLFTFSKMMDTVGKFDPTLRSGGDLEWGKRVFDQGYEQVYAEDACVGHPARSSLSEIKSKIIRVVGGKHDAFGGDRYPTKRFVYTMLADSRNCLKSVAYICGAEQVKGIGAKTKIISVLLFSWFVRAQEELRWQVQGKSR